MFPNADPMSDATFLKSSFYEQLVEHVFIAEVLQEVWFGFDQTIEVLRSEVDNSGYDIVFECNRILRHVQLKTSKENAKAASQKVNVALAQKPSGCIIWLFRQEDVENRRMKLSYRYFGGPAGEPLPSIEGLQTAKHTKRDLAGVRKERPAIKVVPRSKFVEIESTRDLVALLFGLTKVESPRSELTC